MFDTISLSDWSYESAMVEDSFESEEDWPDDLYEDD